MVLKNMKKKLYFIWKAFKLSTIDLVALSWLNIKSPEDRSKVLKIKESDFFLSLKTIYVHDSMSHVSCLSDLFCIYIVVKDEKELFEALKI